MSGLLYDTPAYLKSLDLEHFDAEEFDPDFQTPAPVDANTFILDLVREAKNYAAEAAAIELRVKELNEKKQRKTKAATRLRKWIQHEMTWRKIDKCKDTDYTVSLAKAKTKLVVKIAANVPREYFKDVPTLDKTALNEHYAETGEIPDGCDTETTRTLTVRG